MGATAGVLADGVQALVADVARASWRARGAMSRLGALADLGWRSPAATRFTAQLGGEVRAAAEVVARCDAAQAALQAHAGAVRSG
ncbi:hypothetical protein GTR02_17770 [Kineococcus sp. R8]|nr:hypothetical protein [Kineococcus siccus]